MKKLSILILTFILLFSISFQVKGDARGVKMDFIQTTEDAMIQKLHADIPELEVKGFPDKPESYNFIHPKGTILLHYQGYQSGDSKSTNKINQEESNIIGITLMTRSLRGNGGAYSYIQKIKESLVGYKPLGSSKVYCIKGGFSNYEAGVWTYALSFGFKATFIEEV